MNINFKQERNLNMLLEALFAFVKENWKPLGIILLNFAGPFVLVASISGVYLQTDVSTYAVANSVDIFQQYQAMTASTYYWPSIIFNLLSGTIMMAIVFAYIKSYIKDGIENISQEVILEEVKANFLMILITNLAIGFATLLGIALFVVGAVFLFIALSLTIFIRVNEELTLTEAMLRSMYLVKHNWWDTASKIVIVYIVIMLFGYAFALPELLYSIMTGFNSSLTEVSEPSIIQVILSSFTSFATNLSASVLYVAIAFIYYSLIEKKEAHSLNDRIDNF